MHEVSAARNVVDLIRQSLPASDLRFVRSVKIRIGDQAGIIPASLEFCYTALTNGTALERSSLILEHVPFRIFCTMCRAVYESPDGAMQCPHCSSTSCITMSGMELEVVDLVLEPEMDDSDGNRDH